MLAVPLSAAGPGPQGVLGGAPVRGGVVEQEQVKGRYMVSPRPEEKGWGREVRKTGKGADGGAGGGQVQRELTWMSSEKPVWTEPCRMELRVVPTYSVSPRPSATVRTGPKSSGTWRATAEGAGG